ncbi:MAG: leucine-rich repeat protein [Clostridia bacterium]|nr:leucine-rich repeat protein [Clostridia bacterium]
MNVSTYVYRVSYDVMGGVALADEFKAVGDEMDLPGTEKAGYEFGAWYLTPVGTTGGGKKYDSDVFELTGDLLLYAGYVPKQFEVTLELNNGGYFAVDPGETTATYLQSYVLPVPECGDATKVFNGWYTEANGRGIRYTDGNGVALNVWRDIEDRILVAYWIDMFHYNLLRDDTYSVTAIADKGIINATHLKILPVYNGKQVSTVEGNAFINARKLVSIDIPDTIRNIETGTAFLNCSTLTDINIYDAHEAYPDDVVVQNLEKGNYYSIDGVLFFDNEFNGKEISFYPAGRSGEYAIPEGTETLPTNVFSNSLITKMTIPASVTSINASAFLQCRSLVEIVFEESEGEPKPLELGDRAFRLCTALVSIDLPARIANFNRDVFESCNALAYVNITGTPVGTALFTSKDGLVCNEDGTEIIYAPLAYTGIEGVYTIFPGISRIGENAFKSCKNITKLVIPGYVTSIGNGAFSSNSYLREIVYTDIVDEIEITIGNDAFFGCSSLYEVTLPKHLKTLKSGAFNLSGVKVVNVESVGDVAFENGAFSEKNGVKVLNIGKDLGVIEINGVFGTNIETINVDPANTNYSVEDGVLFNLDKTRIVYYPSGKKGNYEIPFTVTGIGANVFRGKDITKVTINKEITEIGQYAFADCYYLEEVEFEAGRAADAELVLGEGAFYGSAVIAIDIPETVTEIGDKAFAASRLTYANIPSTVTKMGEYEDDELVSMLVFDACTYLYSVKVHADNENFYSDNANVVYLKEDGVVTEVLFAPRGERPNNAIDNDTFDSVVTVPSGVHNVRNDAFRANKQITKIVFTSGSDTAVTVGTNLFTGALLLTEVVLSDGFDEIGKDMFRNCYSLEKITIPASVRNIRGAAFTNCESLKYVIFEERTASQTLSIEDGSAGGADTTVGSGLTGVFAGCVSLQTITFPEGTEKIGAYAFNIDKAMAEEIAKGDPERTGLQSIVIPSTVTTIGNRAFAGYAIKATSSSMSSVADELKTMETLETFSSLASVTFATKSNGTYSLTSLGEEAFACTNIETIVIPTSLVKLSKSVFSGTKQLHTVVFPTGTKIEHIDQLAFASSAVERAVSDINSESTAFTFPATIKVIDKQAFSYCRNITEFTFTLDANGKTKLGNAVSSGSGSSSGGGLGGSIGGGAIGGGGGTTTAIAYAIGKFAFANTAITSFTFPETTKSGGTYEVEANLFDECELLTTVEISSAVTSVNSMFAGCYSITNVVVSENNPNFTNQLDVGDSLPIIYNKTTTGAVTAIRYAYGNLGSSFTVPDGITEIGERAFDGHKELHHIIIPASVTAIEDSAFENCVNLETVTFENGNMLNILGAFAFRNCTSLNNVVLPNSLTALSEGTFYGCSGLENITLSSGLETFGGSAFENAGIVSITIPANVREIGNINERKSTQKIVNGRTTNVYNYVGNVFKGCTSLSSVTFEGNVTLIGFGAFMNCTSLESITLPDTVTNIANSAFLGSGLTSIELPANIVLGSQNVVNGNFTPTSDSTAATTNTGNVFKDCKNLAKVTFKGAVKYLPGYLFSGCSSLDTLEFVQEDGSVLTNKLPENLTLLSVNVFENTGFTSFDLSNTATKVGGNYLFQNSVNLKEIILPTSGIVQVYQYMFNGCVNLENVAYYAEDGTKVNNEIPFSIYAIAANAFQNCKSLETLKLSDQTTQLAMGAFRYCDNLEYVNIPNTISSFASYVFDGCVNYAAENGTFYVPTSVTNMSNMIGFLQDCERIHTVVLHPNLTSLGDTYYAANGLTNGGVRAFMNMPSLTSILIPQNLPYFITENGLIYRGDVLVSTLSNVAVGEIELPSFTRQIASYAFSENTNITGVILNDGLKAIGMYAFANCVNLGGDIVFPHSIEALGTNVFNNTAITSAVVPGNIGMISTNVVVKTLPQYVFANCPYLTSVTIESGITTINIGAFQNSTAIERIVLPETVKTIQTLTFENWTADQTICFRVSEAEAPAVPELGTKCFANVVYGYRD